MHDRGNGGVAGRRSALTLATEARWFAGDQHGSRLEVRLADAVSPEVRLAGR